MTEEQNQSPSQDQPLLKRKDKRLKWYYFHIFYRKYLVSFQFQNPKIPPASEPHPEPSEYMCLVRAVFKNEKISTVVHSKEVNKFQLAYCNLLKSNMDGLKRQKKQKTKKATQ